MWLRLMDVVMVRAKLVKIGNSRGIRLAKPLLEVAGLADEVEIEAAPGVLTIRPSAHPRAGWAEAASSFEPEGLLDDMSATRFDDEEWSWWLKNSSQEGIFFLLPWIPPEDLKSGRRGLASWFRRMNWMLTFVLLLLRPWQLVVIHILFVCVAGLMAKTATL
jgi:antitoxin MazE